MLAHELHRREKQVLNFSTHQLVKLRFNSPLVLGSKPSTNIRIIPDPSTLKSFVCAVVRTHDQRLIKP